MNPTNQNGPPYPAQPNHPDPVTWCTFFEQGLAFHRQGDPAQAAAYYRRALDLNPGAAILHNSLGVTCFQSGDFQAAAICFRQAANLEKRTADFHFNLGNALQAMGELDQACTAYAQAVAIRPDYADAYYNLGNALKDLGRCSEAIENYSKALNYQPQSDVTWNNMGIALLKLGRTAEAIASFQRAVALKPDNLGALYNLGLGYQRHGQAETALPYVDRVLAQSPDHAPALALWVPLLQELCDWQTLTQAAARLETLTRVQLAADQRPAESPFLSFTRSRDPQRNFLIARAWSRHLDRMLARERLRLDAIAPMRTPSPGPPITIGYLSEQFRDAATAHLAAGLFSRHDRNRFRVIAYSLGRDDGSSYRRRIEQGVDEFVDLRHVSADQAALRMRRDQVDILVDLIGWMHGHRMEIPALRPAPLQVNYLGFPGTTGAAYMDYIVADATVIPAEHFSFYAEKVIWMPYCYQVTDPDPPISCIQVSREASGLPEQGVVFASFCTDYKIEPAVFDLWMDILRAVGDSVLWLLVRTNTAQAHLRREAGRRGVDPTRLIFAQALPKDRHLARLKLVDVALDTLSVNGHTTTSDALCAGVPVVSMIGAHFASRVAGSLLRAAGMQRLIAQDGQSYCRLAIDLARAPERLRRLKAELACRKGPLFDTSQWVRDLEKAYLTIWQRHLRGLAPQNVAVA